MRPQEGNTPTHPGLYVVYVPFTGELTDRNLAQWHNGRWWKPLSDAPFRDKVLGYIGPLPVMRWRDLRLRLHDV